MTCKTKLMMAALVPAVALMAGCSSDSSELDDEEHVRIWANSASAVGVYTHAYEPIAFADGQLTFADPSCPQTTDDGTTVTITGGCTSAADGKMWGGSATVVRSGDGDRTLTLDEYGSYDGNRVKTTGTVEIRRTDASTHTFDVQLVHEGGMKQTISYSGRVEGGYDAPTTWYGSGEIVREGMLSPTGTIKATTDAQLLDDSLCKGQSASGNTTIEQDGQIATITYDGATDCDDDHAARWSFDGEDRGLVTGVTCAVGAVGAPAKAPAGLLLLLGAGLIAFVRRRKA